MKISILIPTRNRPDLVPAAISSVLGQGWADLEVVVSDNSSPKEAEQVRAYCARITDPRLRYIRPETELPMGLHWSWALPQLTGDYVGIVTDRSIMSAGTLPRLAEILEKNTVDVISAPFDWVAGYEPPYYVIQKRYTNQVVACDTTRVAERLRTMDMPWYFLPRWMNGFIKRTVMEAMVAKYGHIVETISPDFYFGFLLLDHLKTFHYWDFPAYVHYGLSVSNGWGFERGDKNRTVTDFLNLVGKQYDCSGPDDEPLSKLTFSKLPWIWGVGGNIWIEWERVKSLQTSGRFGEVDRGKYYLAMCNELAYQLKSEMRARNERILERFRVENGLAPEPLKPKISRAVDKLARSHFGCTVLLPTLYKLADMGVDPLNVYRYSIVAGHFSTHEEALNHHQRNPRAPSPTPAFDPRAIITA